MKDDEEVWGDRERVESTRLRSSIGANWRDVLNQPAQYSSKQTTPMS